MAAHNDRIDARDWSLLGLLSILWGGSFFFNGFVLKQLPPLTVVFLRVAIAALILLPLLFVYRIRCRRACRAGGRFSRSGFSTTCCRFR
jgi:drug/metabolite transporter (DMT)-like permease